ncbi:ribose-phosphate pyrophosphokinase [Gammaproteobacteria bacterium]
MDGCVLSYEWFLFFRGEVVMLVLSFPDYVPQGRALATALSVAWAEIEIHHFPDGESRIRLPPTLPDEVILCRSLDHPNNKLVELILVARAARQLGVRHLTLIAPYLCYMRQDMAFHPGEIVSQRIVGGVLGELFDAVITVDPHLHRIRFLEEVLPAHFVLALSATSLMGDFLKHQPLYENALLLGPDQEAKQWVEAIAHSHGLRHAVATKQRSGDCAVSITLPDLDYRDQMVVVVDDVASTGCTLAKTAEALYARGVARVAVLITHALFCTNSPERLKQAGINEIWSTDSVAHHTNVIALADLLVMGIRQFNFL